MAERTRRKIAIPGGGTGALAAAFGLTERPGWQDAYEITVYQLGWRLGGKGASGRNAEKNQRIEEHGLHVWSGFYDNAFRVLRRSSVRRSSVRTSPCTASCSPPTQAPCGTSATRV